MTDNRINKPSINHNPAIPSNANSSNANPSNTNPQESTSNSFVGPDLIDGVSSVFEGEEQKGINNNNQYNQQGQSQQGYNQQNYNQQGYNQTPPNYQGGYQSTTGGYAQAPYYPYQKKSGTWWKVLLIVGGILLAIIFIGYQISSFFNSLFYISEDDMEIDLPVSEYIARIAVEGEITASDDSYLSEGTSYNHQFTLESIDEIIDDENNVALLLFVDTPGGGVYESDQLYNKIKEYQEETERPVYVAMGSMAASGGYYISAPADKILADRNTWTGSIGVTMGTVYDITGFLKKNGIKAENLTSGDNKAMGSMVEPMTDEQRKIFQSLIDDAYNQFVGLIAEGRDMELDKVKKLGDGRIYTANQAKENGLIDDIATEEEAIEMLQKDHDLDDAEVFPIEYYSEDYWADDLFYSLIKPTLDRLKSIGKGDLETALELSDDSKNVPLKYLYEK